MPRCDDFNRGDNEGVGYFDVNQRAGIRWNATKAFLRPAFPRPNLQVWTGAHINRVVFDGVRATGVEIAPLGGGEPVTAQLAPGGEVVLATGSIGSPQILQLSGIGDPALLRGERHRDARRPARRRREPAGPPADPRRLRHRGREDAEHDGGDALGQGDDRPALRLEAQRPDEHGAVAARRLHAQQPRARAPRTSSTTCSRSRSMRSASRCIRFDAFTASVCNLNPTSRGHVRIRSADPATPPRIAPDYLSTDDDRHIAAAEPARDAPDRRPAGAGAVQAEARSSPASQFESDADLATLAGDIGTTIFHPVGTAKMGPASDPMAVVDARLRVHGVEGLRVVDASVMPTITSGNTNAPTLMIAERAAEWILRGAA